MEAEDVVAIFEKNGIKCSKNTWGDGYTFFDYHPQHVRIHCDGNGIFTIKLDGGAMTLEAADGCRQELETAIKIMKQLKG